MSLFSRRVFGKSEISQSEPHPGKIAFAALGGEEDMPDDFDMDLAYEMPEGESELMDSADDWFDEGDWADDDFYDDFDDESDDALDEAVAYALMAEDSDEFFKRLARGLKKVGSTIGKGIKAAAPIVGTLAPLVPGIGTAIGAGAQLVNALSFEAESETEALEIAAEVAKKAPGAALPVVVGLTAKKIVGKRGPAMSKPARKKVAKDVRQAVKTMVKKQGTKGAQAMAQIAKQVNAAAKSKPTSPPKKAAVVKRVATKTAKSTAMTRSLSKRASTGAKMKARKVAKKSATLGGGVDSHSIVIKRPSRITITPI